jgi:phthalate 3,4-dioxygenase beta subunit
VSGTTESKLEALVERTRRFPHGHPEQQAATDFLIEEADALDRRDFDRWLTMLADDVRYRMPVRVTAIGNEFSAIDFFHEDLFSLHKRVQRFATEHAWAEDPPSRTRRFVTNVRVFSTGRPSELAAQSYLLLYRSRGDQLAPSIVSAARLDLLRNVGDHLELVHRLITLDDAVLHTQNLAIFL